LEDARKVNPEAQLNETVLVETTPSDFGRVAAQTARQVIQQKLREAERSAQLAYFERQVGEIVSGIVQATSVMGATLGLDMKAEGIMPNNQKIPGERIHIHDRMRAVVLEVKDGTRGPQIILSRAHRNFLRRLLENEVPEIYHGIVEIRAIAREPGQRAKVAVSATQAGVDPVGACVGIKGVRIQGIVRELHDEKIDIIEWNADTISYISKAISPARVTGVYLTETSAHGKTATVVVQEDQLSLAIGRDGQNARLAAKLTGWRIDIKSVIESAGDALDKMQKDSELAALLPAVVESIPTVEGILTKKAQGRPLTPEEYQVLATFVDRVERRTIQIVEEAQKAEEERVAIARSEIPETAFSIQLEQLALKEKVYNILVEAGYETIGDLSLIMKLDPDKVLGLTGIGPKAMQNIEEALANVTYPEPEKVEEALEVEAVEVEPAAEVVVEVKTEAIEAESVGETPSEVVVAEAIEPVEPAAVAETAAVVPETEGRVIEKEAVTLDELFTLRPELIKVGATAEDEEENGDKKKSKKKKKKFVEVEYDPDLDKVLVRKMHKRGDTDLVSEDW
ncbi:MAG: transcription termination factor NusA, partial [Anaerolineales bacterium]|nr:transcription termination factor NusA [Anaerolineales bacterium]